ncbi:MAG: hypothetical protein H0U90_06655 [Actinobacteria bacterium]|nr:hypothetical protein [Actinomycetota bacterium]
MADDRVRIEIAFEGGQTIGGLVPSATVDELRDALARGPEGVVEVPTEDGTYLVPLHAVMYVKRFVKESRIGFGQAG